MPRTESQPIEDLFAQHFVRMRDLACFLTGNGAVAEEIAMEAFLRTYLAWRKASAYDQPIAYVRTTVVNLCRSRWRRLRVEAKAALRNRHEVDRVEWEASPLETAIDVRDAVRTLPVGQRTVVVLRFFEGLSEEEIAHTLQCSTGTVKSQLSKAKSSLNRRLSPVKAGEVNG